MAKKKNQSKKHRFKYTESPSETAIATETGAAQPSSKPAVAAAARQSDMSDRDFSYVTRDLRHIAILAVCLVLLEVGLAYAFNHTGLGAQVDGFIKL